MTSAANFYSTHQTSPSIFEVIAQRNLHSILYPALEKLVTLLRDQSPKHFTWISEHYDETFLLLDGLVQFYYLKAHSASFSEHFYNLKRLRSLDEYELSAKQKCLSWLCLAFAPYVVRKAQKRVAEYRLQLIEQNDQNDTWKKSAIMLSSLAHVSWGTWIVANYLRYMSANVTSQLPDLQLLDVKLVYDNNIEEEASFWSSLIKGELSLTDVPSQMFKNGVQGALKVSAFLVQFLQVWNSEKSHMNVTNLPSVQAPEKHLRSDQYKEKCPICLQSWKIPTVLPISGYVFCFSCIYRYVNENRECPVSKLPAKPLDIVRLYQ